MRRTLAGNETIDAYEYFRQASPEIREMLENGVELHTCFRWLLSASVVYERMVEDISQETRFEFYSGEQIILRVDEIDEQLEIAISRLLTKILEMSERESNFVFKRVYSSTIRLARYNPIGGSSYIQTPKELMGKHAIVNVQNNNVFCFLYALASAIHPVQNNPQRPEQYEKYFSEFHIKGLKFPLAPKDISKFEDLNPSIAVTVLHYDTDKVIVPLVHSKHIEREHEVTLFLLAEQCKTTAGNLVIAAALRPYKYHYTWVKNSSYLFRSVTKHTGAGTEQVCYNCFRRFWSVNKFNRHRPDCLNHDPLRITFPSTKFRKSKKYDETSFVGVGDEAEEEEEYECLEDALGFGAKIRVDANGNKPENILEFEKFKDTHMVPFVLYVDFETFIKKDIENDETEEEDIHEPSGFCCLRVSSFDFLNDEKAFVYSGPDVMQHFYEHIMAEHCAINDILSLQKPMDNLSDDEQKRYDTASVCGTCKKKFTVANVKVRHHNHISGKFIGATCNKCNLKLKPAKAYRRKIVKKTITTDQRATIDTYVENHMKDKFFVPVIAHNMRGYDSHVIIKHMEKSFASENIHVIASNTEKFTSFQIGQLRFLDSLQFLNASLDALVSNLKRDLEKEGVNRFSHTRRHFPDRASFTRVTSKGVYPYEFMDGAEKFNEKSLPSIEHFFSKLNDESISEEEYTRAQDVWKHFEIQDMHQYHDLYLKTDTLLLADVFENFRRVAMDNYQLDPCHYFTSPGLSLSACLKHTAVELELFTDIDQLLFIERGIRGGISTICNRYSKANNKYLPDYDSSLPSKYIMYLDANNLYGYAMSEPLPVGGFKFLSFAEIQTFKNNKNERILTLGDDDETGYIFDVDLTYPDNLHDEHNDYPLAPESFEVTADIISPYAKELLGRLGRKPCRSTRKLVPNLHTKRNYVVHYRTLQFYIKHGLVVDEVHKVMQFTQRRWLAPYIDLNTQKRKAATSSFEKDFYKLLNNSLFGKTMESLRKRIDVKLVCDQIQAERCIANPAFESFRIINEDITMVKTRMTKIKWNKPTYIGFCVLELSKLLMYQFHYDHVRTTYGNRAKLLFTDTVSLCYELTTDDAYADMLRDAELFDTSDYPRTHANYSADNCKVIGKFKDECNGTPVLEFVGLRPKMYSLLTLDGKEKSTAKGIKTSYQRKHIKNELYKHCLFHNTTTTASYYQIGSDNHQLSTNKIVRAALSPYDDK